MFSLTCFCGLPKKKNLVFSWSNGLGLEMFKNCFAISDHSSRNVRGFLHSEILIQLLLNETT